MLEKIRTVDTYMGEDGIRFEFTQGNGAITVVLPVKYLAYKNDVGGITIHLTKQEFAALAQAVADKKFKSDEVMSCA